MGKHTVQTAVASRPSDNSAELDNDDASGTKRGVMASNAATSLHASATSQESRPLIDCLLIVMGFGLCRAWIVSCLSASVASYSLRTDWVYLLAGAGAAALAAFAMTRYAGSLARMHEHLTDYMVGLILASIVCVPAATWLDSPTLLLLGLIVGGAGSGLLQVMWGERFAAQSLYYSLVCAPAAAIVTGIMLSLTTTSNQLVFVVLPLLSGLLLALECKRCRVNWKTGLPEGDVEEGMDAGGALHADVQTEPWTSKGAGEEAAKEEACIGAGARTGTETNTKAPAHAGLFASHQDRMRLAKDTAKLMVSIMTFSFLVRVFDAFPIVGDDPFDLFGGSGSFSLVLVGILFLVVSFLIKDRMNVTFLYRLSLPVMIAGLVAIALLFDQRTPASVIIIGIGYELFDILAWVLFSETARHRGWAWSPYVFGIGVASMYVGMAAGYVLSAVLHPLIESGAAGKGGCAVPVAGREMRRRRPTPWAHSARTGSAVLPGARTHAFHHCTRPAYREEHGSHAHREDLPEDRHPQAAGPHRLRGRLGSPGRRRAAAGPLKGRRLPTIRLAAAVVLPVCRTPRRPPAGREEGPRWPHRLAAGRRAHRLAPCERPSLAGRRAKKETLLGNLLGSFL